MMNTTTQNINFCNQIENFTKSLHMKMEIEKKSKNTIVSYMRTYKDFTEFCKQHYKVLTFENIREEDIYAFIKYKSFNMNKQGDLSISTTNSLVAHLKRLFRHIERNHDGNLYNFDKVFEDIKLKQPKRIPKVFDNEPLEKVLSLIEKKKISSSTFVNYRNALLFKLMLFAGLRASEVVSIRLSNIKRGNEDDPLLEINVKGKGDKERIAYVEAKLVEDEIDVLKEDFHFRDNDYIAKTSRGGVMDRIQLSSSVNSLCNEAGVKGSGAHILRHTYAKQLESRGVPITTIQALLGHSSITTTAIYINPTKDMVKKEVLRAVAACN